MMKIGACHHVKADLVFIKITSRADTFSIVVTSRVEIR
jgi:hypothetical protein